MRRVLGSLLLAALLLATVLLAGCGDSGETGDDPGGSGAETGTPAPSSQSPTAEPTLPDGQSGEGWQLVEIVSATAADGQVSATPTPVTTAQEVASFSAQFSRPEMQREIERVVHANAPADGFRLVAAVVAIGCDVPPGVTYVDGEVRPLKVTDPHIECFAPVTSVAVLAVAE